MTELEIYQCNTDESYHMTWVTSPQIKLYYGSECLCHNLSYYQLVSSLQWHHNGRDGVSNHQRLDCLLKRLFMCRSKKTSKPRVTGLCEGHSPVAVEFPSERPSSAIFFFHLMTSSCRSKLSYLIRMIQLWVRHHLKTDLVTRYTVDISRSVSLYSSISGQGSKDKRLQIIVIIVFN